MAGTPASTSIDASVRNVESMPLSTGSKTGPTELPNGEMASKPTRPPPLAQAQVSKRPPRPRPPPPVRSMTLSGTPKEVDIARARARARATSTIGTEESQFHSVRHLVTPPPVKPRMNVFSFKKEERRRSYSSASSSSGISHPIPAVRKYRSLSPDCDSYRMLEVVKETAKETSSPNPGPKTDASQSSVDKEVNIASVGPVQSKADSSPSESARVIPPPPTTQPPKRPPRPYAPPIFEAKVARKRPPPVPHVIDIRDSSPQMARAGKSPPTPKSTVINTRGHSESPRRPPPPTRSAQVNSPKTDKGDTMSTVQPPSNDDQDQAGGLEATPTRSRPAVRFASPPPTTSSPPLSPSLDEQVSRTGNRDSPSRPAPTVQLHLEVESQSLDTPTAAAVTTATPTPSHLNLTQPDTESSPCVTSTAEEDESGNVGAFVPAGKSPSPSRSRRFIKSMKTSFRNIKRKKGNEGEKKVLHKSQTLPHTRGDGATSPRNQLQAARAHTVYERGSHDEGYDKQKYPDELPQGIIDPVIVKAIAYLNKENVLVEEGLFRIPGDLTAIKTLRARFARREDVDLDEVLDPHTIAGLLKVHFREMRISIIPRGPVLAELVRAVQSHDVQLFTTIIGTIEPHLLATLRMLSEVLAKISEHSSKNRMTSGTLATSCGPSIFPYLPPSNANAIIKFLIDHCSEIFTE